MILAYRTLIVLALGLTTNAYAQSDFCKEWWKPYLEPSEVAAALAPKTTLELKKKITVFHWFDCAARDGRPEFKGSKADESEVSRLVTAKLYSTSPGKAGKGLYTAFDPSSTCRFGGVAATSKPCLMVADLSTEARIGMHDIYNPLLFDRLEPFGSARFKRAVNENLVNKLFAEGCFKPDTDLPNLLEKMKSNLWPVSNAMLSSSLPPNDRRATFDAIHYDYDSETALPEGSPRKYIRRALALQPGILSTPANWRIYDVNSLREPQTPEARNIVHHLRETSACPSITKDLPEMHDDSSYQAWVKSLVPEMVTNFDELLQARTLNETGTVLHSN